MCLSLKLVGNCVKFSALLVLLLGVIGIVCAVSIGKDEIMVSSVQDTKKTIMGVTIAFSVLLVLLGLAGSWGAWKNSSCCLAIYNIGLGIFFVAFLIISIVAFAVFKKYTTINLKDQTVCEGQSWLQGIDKVANVGEAQLCSNQCPCQYHDNSTRILSGISIDFAAAAVNVTVNNNTKNNSSNASSSNTSNTNNSDSNSTNNRHLFIDTNGSIRVQDCPAYKNFSLADREYSSTLEILERQFQCAGVCSNSRFYAFSDINAGQPKDDCATVLVDIFVSYSKKIGAATIVMTILLFLTLVASFCLCCHPDKRKEEGGFYSKMTSM